MKKTIDTIGTSVTFTFDGMESLKISTAQITPDVATHAMLHGLAQKIGDAAAISKSAENGYTVTEAMRREAVAGMIDQLHNGSWNIAAGARKAPQNPTILAIAAKLGVSYVEAEAEIQRRMLAELAE